MTRDTLKEKVESGNPNVDVWLFMFGLNYAFWHLTVAVLNFEVKNKLMVAELFDLFTPFVMTFLIFKLYLLIKQPIRNSEKRSIQTAGFVLIILGLIFFIEGHGMHLSANAITRHLIGQEGLPIFNLTYFFDEILGHLLWDGGLVIISIALLILSFAEKRENSKNLSNLVLVGSFFYGFTYFCNAVEGQTVVFTFPVSIIIPGVILFLIRCRRIGSKHPVILFYLLSYVFAFCWFVYWAVRNSGFPQFSELGWI